MSYKTILVNLDIDGPVVSILELATDLAKRFEARLVGFCAADAYLPFSGYESGPIAAEVWEQQREDNERRFKEIEAEFRKAASGVREVDWRAMAGSPTFSLARCARLADLIVTTAASGASTGDAYRAVDPGSLVLQAGRPVLVAADGSRRAAAKKAVIAWKDTREARRAVSDAVPLLAGADEVIAVTIDRDANEDTRDGLADVAVYLRNYGINTRTEVLADHDESEALGAFVIEHGADLVVSGAFGHSRLREWAFGGVTRSLLGETGINRFMSS